MLTPAPSVQGNSISNAGHVYTTASAHGNHFIGNLPLHENANATNKVIQSINVSKSPKGAAFDSSNGYVYVTNCCSDNVSVINGSTNKVIQSINVGKHPFGVEFDSSNGYVYVTNDISDNVSVLGSVKYTVTVTETGLPTGTTWYVNITNGASYSSKTTTISFRAINGTYDYTVASMNKDYAPVTSSSTFTVNGKPVSVSVTFKAVTYTVTVTETGLPTGTTWYVNITGHDSGAITGTSYSFSLTNGTYSYTIATADKTYSPSPNSGSLTVNGKAVSKSVAFSLVTYTVTVTETGLPTGTTWYVNITGHDSGAITGTSYSFSLTNGTYSYTIGSNNTNYNANGSRVIINGHSKTISITFTASSSPSKSSHSGIPGIELYGIIGIAAAIVVAGSVLFIIRRKK